MDASLRAEVDRLRAMGSEQAATYLIENSPRSQGRTFLLMQHMSWKVVDQRRLATHFLPQKPFAQSSPYQAFASFMSLTNFLAAVANVWPESDSDQALLRYHLEPILKKYETSAESTAKVRAFLATH